MKMRVFFAAGILFAGSLRAGDADALTARQVPGVETSPKSYAELISNIERVSGLKVKIDPELDAFMKMIAVYSWGSLQPVAKTISLGQFLDAETKRPGLRWEIDAGAGTVTLLPNWLRDDPRSAGQLLKALCDATAEAEKTPLEKNSTNFLKWAEARKPCGTLLGALLSKKENYAKAWRAHMLGRHLWPLLAEVDEESPDIVYAGGFADTEQRAGVLIVVRHQIEMYPGEGGFEYYYFTPEGQLICADLLSGGWRSEIHSITAETSKTTGQSELTLDTERGVQKFVMKPDKLTLEAPPGDGGNHFGRSLLDETLKSH